MEKTKAKVELEETINGISSIILWNDDVNSFDWVIESLVDVLGHNKLQAEQCAMMVHNSGKCSVKSGWIEELEPLAKKLEKRDLTITIQ
jgi:ATP-dependent Clp protease adaptor protein ClpS